MDIKKQIEMTLKTVERNGIDDLLQWMDENGFYSAPCSGKYHLSEEGGLAKHSLNVCKTAIAIVDALFLKEKNLPSFKLIDSVIICALLHDLGKSGQYGKPNYIKSEDPAHGAFRTNWDLLYLPHEVRSIAIASRFIDLTEEEQFAIAYHNGLYGELKSIKGNETPLYMIIHFADMWASRYIERSENK